MEERVIAQFVAAPRGCAPLLHPFAQTRGGTRNIEGASQISSIEVRNGVIQIRIDAVVVGQRDRCLGAAGPSERVILSEGACGKQRRSENYFVKHHVPSAPRGCFAAGTD